jgi:putative transposase
MTYNPDIHHRNSVRLRSYDYRSKGAYFVTICTFQKEAILADIVNGTASLSSLGKAVKECWQQIPEHFPNVDLDEFIIMPNHIHGIIFINDSVGATHASPDLTAVATLADSPNVTTSAPDDRARRASPLQKPGPMKQSLGAIIGSFKSACTKRINESRNTAGMPVWQRNYHERVIRNEEELHSLRDYILTNPVRWEGDGE